MGCFILSVLLFVALCPTAHAAEAGVQVETAWFPANTMELTQLAYEHDAPAPNQKKETSHDYENSIDIAPHGNVFSPFTGKVIYTDPNWGYVVLESKNKIHWADGTYDYMTVSFMHDSDISNVRVGDTIDQGEVFYQAGGMGDGNPEKYENHVHLAIYRGRPGMKSPYGKGDVYAYNALFINPNMTTSYAGRGEGAVEGSHTTTNNAPTNYAGLWKKNNGYLSTCTAYPSYCVVSVTNNTYIKTLPCSRKTHESSDDIRKAVPGDTFTVIGIYRNSVGNLWYVTEVDGQIGYIYSGDTKLKGRCNDMLTVKNVKAPEMLSQGNYFSIAGDISCNGNCTIKTLYASIYGNSDRKELYKYSDNVNCTSYSLFNSKIDAAMLFNELPSGEYLYGVAGEIPFCFSEDGKTLESPGMWTTLIYQGFTVK